MIYLSTPYSDPNPAIRYYRFRINEEMCANMLMKGEFVYAPIVHHHTMALRYDLPKDFSFWESWDLHMVELSEEVRVIKLPGWRSSRGLTCEVDHAQSIGVAISYIEPNGNTWNRFRNVLELPPACA